MGSNALRSRFSAAGGDAVRRARAHPRLTGLASSVVLALVVILSSNVSWRVEPPPVIHGGMRIVRYALTVRNLQDRPLSDIVVSAYAPVNRTSVQKADPPEVSVPHGMEEDALGNRLVNVRIGVLPAHASSVFVLSSNVRITLPELERPGWLSVRASRYTDVDRRLLWDVVGQIRGWTRSAKARNLFAWMTGYDPAEVPERFRGQTRALRMPLSTRYPAAFLYVALARELGIPSRVVGGFVSTETEAINPKSYRFWAEIYLGAWRVVDPERGIFVQIDRDYIALRILDDEVPGRGLESPFAFISPSTARISVTVNTS